MRFGSGPRRPHELVVWVDPSYDLGARPVHEVGELGLVGRLKIGFHLPLDGKVTDPDRTHVGAKPIGPARLIGFEHRRRQQHGPVKISPADQGMLRVEPREPK